MRRSRLLLLFLLLLRRLRRLLILLREVTAIFSINDFIALRKVSRYSQLLTFFIAEIYRVASLDKHFSLFIAEDNLRRAARHVGNIDSGRMMRIASRPRKYRRRKLRRLGRCGFQ